MESRPLDIGFQMKISSTRITTPKNCSRSEAYQLLSESDRTSSKENNDDEISQPLDTGFQLVDTFQSTMTLKNCSMSEGYELLSQQIADRTSSQQNRDGEISQPLDTGLQLENSSRRKITPTNCSRNEAYQLSRERCAVGVKQYNDPTVNLSERPVMDYGGNARGKLPHQVEPTSLSGGLIGVSKSDPGYSEKCGEESHNQAYQSSSQISIESLPNEILMEIFDLVKTKNVLSLVCRNWRHVDRSLQKRVMIRNTAKRVFPLKAQGYAILTTVIIDNKFPDSPEALVRDEDLSVLAKEFPNLQQLELLGCSLVTACGLTDLVGRCSRLVYLHLRCCCHFDDDAVLEVVRASKSLQHLRLSYCEVTSDGIQTLRTFTTVSAEGCPLSEAVRSFLSSV